MKIVSAFVVLVAACISIANEPTTAPATQPISYKWVLADGSPTILQSIVDQQPLLRSIEEEKVLNAIADSEREYKLARAKRSKQARDQEQAIKSRIDELNRSLNAIRRCEFFYMPPRDWIPKAPDQIGSLAGFVVLQVVDDQNAIIQVMERVVVQDYPPVSETKPLTVMWLSGIDTSGWVDQSIVSYSSAPIKVYCDRTRQYATAGGSTKTVAEVRPYTIENFVRVEDVESNVPAHLTSPAD